VQQVHQPFIGTLAACTHLHWVGVGTMQPAFSAALEHIHVMQDRISQQASAIEVLQKAGQDTSDAVRRLKLLHAALDEMRIQLAQLAPNEAQVSDPIWARKLGLVPGQSQSWLGGIEVTSWTNDRVIRHVSFKKVRAIG
jgi:hypothetical protein